MSQKYPTRSVTGTLATPGEAAPPLSPAEAVLAHYAAVCAGLDAMHGPDYGKRNPALAASLCSLLKPSLTPVSK